MDIVIKIGGPAGSGITKASQGLCNAFMLGGLNIYTRSEVPSLIRGGHNSVTIRVSNKQINCVRKKVDILLALDKETIKESDLYSNTIIIYDKDMFSIKKTKCINLNLPIKKLISELELPKILMNTIIIGASLAVLNYDLKLFEEIIKKEFSEKRLNLNAAKAGYNYMKFIYDSKIKLKKVKHVKKMFVTGNDSLSLGAIKSDCKFLSSYPMTPSTTIMNFFEKYNYMKQASDEISAINMALGASYAGIRAMTSTSGGGLALMAETISLLGMQEIPLVIVDVQRPGPATGLPTRQGQGDLNFVMNIGHGDFPKLVLAPGDHEELFYETFRAFDLAEKYQIPTIILSDRNLASSYKSLKPFGVKGMKVKRYLLNKEVKNYKRFADTKIGVSKRAIPGTKNIFSSSSDEHDEFGFICECPKNRKNMEEKRIRKLKYLLKEIPKPKLYGPKSAELTVIGWGSTKGAILEAIKGKNINFLQIMYMFPFHSNYVKNILLNAKNVVCVEENSTGQLSNILKMFTGFEIKKKILKYNGRAFFPEEIRRRL